MNIERACSACGAVKPIEMFKRHKQCVGGVTHQCKTCANAKAAADRARTPRKPLTEAQKLARREKYARDIALSRAKARAVYGAAAESRRQTARVYAANNPDKVNTWRKQHYANTAEKRKAAAKSWYVANMERAREARRAWADANKGRVAAAKAARKRAIRRATPAWVDTEEIVSVYARASALREQGLDVHVDHVVPLKARAVCGLHVPWNLQVLPAAANLRKSNREWPDMP